MSFIKLVTLLVSLALEIVRYLERRELIRQVEASQLEALLERANEIAKVARKARVDSELDDSDDSLLSDPNNRANWPTHIEGNSTSNRPSNSKDSL